MHTCRKWRHIVFTSQGVLRLRLFCTHGTPVQKTLLIWPALPIVVEYGGLPTLDPPAPEDEDNIIAALKQSDRVISISLTITSPLLKKLYTIEGEFSELQDLVLLSRSAVWRTLKMPSAFRWGQRLGRLHSTEVAFPTFPQLLSSSTNLIDLQLHQVFFPWQFPPDMLMKALSNLGQLRSLSLHFSSVAYYHRALPPDTERKFLPVLTRLNYQGSMEYLEDTVAKIDAPFLKDIEITFFDYLIVAHSKLSEFIDWIESYRLQFGAHILSSQPYISISIKPRIRQPGAPTCLKLRMPSRLQTSSMAQICLFNDEGDLRVTTTRPSGRMNGSYSRELLNFLSKFTGKKLCQLDMSHSINVVHALQPLGNQHEKFPTLHKLYILQPGPRDVVLRETVVSFMMSRRLSGHPIQVEYERPCDIHEPGETGTVFGQCKDRSLLTWF